MAGLEGRVEFQGAEVREHLEDIRRRADDLTPLLRDIGEKLMESAQKRIEVSNETPDGVPWPKSFRVIVGQGGKTLLETGDLKRSISSQVTGNQVEIGTNMRYAAVHQFGATIKPVTAPYLQFRLADGRMVSVGSVTIPARPYLGISEADEALIVQDLIPAHFGVAADG